MSEFHQTFATSVAKSLDPKRTRSSGVLVLAFSLLAATKNAGDDPNIFKVLGEQIYQIIKDFCPGSDDCVDKVINLAEDISSVIESDITKITDVTVARFIKGRLYLLCAVVKKNEPKDVLRMKKSADVTALLINQISRIKKLEKKMGSETKNLTGPPGPDAMVGSSRRSLPSDRMTPLDDDAAKTVVEGAEVSGEGGFDSEPELA